MQSGGGPLKAKAINAEPEPSPSTGGDTPSRLSAAAKTAGGLPAVEEVARVMLREEGTLRGPAALALLNQKDGIDCPGCAWPDPEGHRSSTEFCENGAKHIAEETTTRLAGPEFF